MEKIIKSDFDISDLDNAPTAATRDYYGSTLVKLGGENQNIIVLDADLSGSTKTAKFAKEFPERFFNFGIAESNMMGQAAGLALSGKTVFASTFAIFATLRPFEQIRNSIAAQNINVNIAATHAGVSVGMDGMSHQAIEDIAIMRVLPNMHVYVPADAVATAAMIESAAKTHGPAYIRMSRPKTPVIYNDQYEFYPGKSTILRDSREARVAFLATGNMVYEGLKAAELLERDGYSTIVVDIASIKPIDRETIVNVARRSRLLVTLEEHSILGGLGGAVAEVLSEDYPARLMRIGIQDIFGESGSPEALFQQFGLDSQNIYRRVMKKIENL